MLRIGVLASHQGSNFQAIVNACETGQIPAIVSLLICNNSSAPVMVKARNAGIPAIHLSSQNRPSAEDLDKTICRQLIEAGVNLVVLAGYMKKLGPCLLTHFSNNIINVHPSLLPRYGGAGFFGARVHEAVIEAGDSDTGATVHLVNDEYDKGEVLMQKKIKVYEGDTPELLAKRLHPIEHELLIKVIQQFAARA